MPTYDYRCERTGEMFELWQSFADAAITTCPLTHNGDPEPCGSEVKKVFSKVGISFKGQGFYKNDHGSSSPSTSGDSGAASSESTKTGSESSSSSTGSNPSSSTSTSSD